MNQGLICAGIKEANGQQWIEIWGNDDGDPVHVADVFCNAEFTWLPGEKPVKLTDLVVAASDLYAALNMLSCAIVADIDSGTVSVKKSLKMDAVFKAVGKALKKAEGS
jgi:hypothetical protein